MYSSSDRGLRVEFWLQLTASLFDMAAHGPEFVYVLPNRWESAAT